MNSKPLLDRNGNAILPFKKWTTWEGLRFLTQFLRELDWDEVETLNLAPWELALISYSVLRVRKLKKDERSGKAPAEAKRLSQELEIFREHEPPSKNILERLRNLDQSRFIGNRTHLARLYACVPHYTDDWDRWRKRSKAIPDLRGADLTELDLRRLNMESADLRGADLSGVIARTGSFRHADFRRAAPYYADFSHADLEHADFRNAVLCFTMFNGSILKSAILRNSKLIGTCFNNADLKDADLRGSIIWGISTWDIANAGDINQSDLYVFTHFIPEELSSYTDEEFEQLKKTNQLTKVNKLEVAHFISLIKENPAIGNVINASVEKIVLLLGRFVGKERKILNRLQCELPEHGYIPVVFDFAEPENRDTIETVSILAGLSHFVIANLSNPRSTPLECHLVIPNIAVPFVPIVRRGEKPFAMFTALQRKYPWVLPTVTYTSEADLIRKLRTEILEPAARKARAIQRTKHPIG